MKKYMIPNLLTLIRICLVPIMIILSLFKAYKIVIFFAIIGALTDMLDGKLARYWHVTSLKGAKLDDIADKIFSIGLLICLVSKYKNIVIILFLEILIGTLNYYYYKKTDKTETLMVGKVKTTFLFITIILYFLNIITNKFSFLNSGFKFTTINLQILCLISYYLNYYKTTHNIKENNEQQELLNDNTIIVNNIDDLYRYKHINKDDLI